MNRSSERSPGGVDPTVDPTGIEEPHDVLAADQFAIPAPEERPPVDPTGIAEPHDVLAADQFAIPAPDATQEASSRASAGAGQSRGLARLGPWLALTGAVVVVALAYRRARRP
ncbi:hypothetical protein [Thermoleophilum album]|uniref:Uncharacterized protein n=1 Tax=Thermoleophilum album TaxID=29539 RepID=A0A1H6FHU4_THEAL|nr:hypothetical protein [Thermoleophilum album]SEH10407.1 hypothetical protein SAMN02745716_0256 [Thermoleophilum album]